LLKQRA